MGTCLSSCRLPNGLRYLQSRLSTRWGTRVRPSRQEFWLYNLRPPCSAGVHPSEFHSLLLVLDLPAEPWTEYDGCRRSGRRGLG